MTAPQRELLTVAELSAQTGLSPSTLRRCVKKGRIPSIQPAGKGGKLLFTRDAVARALDPATTSARPGSLGGRRPNWILESQGGS